MPLSELPTSTPRTDLKHCRGLLRSGSRSFFAASLLLPQPTRNAAISLYAFCRLADDAIDDSDDPGLALQLLHNKLRRKAVDHVVQDVVVTNPYQFGFGQTPSFYKNFLSFFFNSYFILFLAIFSI